jgi:hypothetical protein
VTPDIFNEIIPKEPFFAKSSASSATSNSSFDNSGEAKIIDLKSPIPLFE